MNKVIGFLILCLFTLSNQKLVSQDTTNLDPEIKYLMELLSDEDRLDSLKTVFSELPGCEKLEVLCMSFREGKSKEGGLPYGTILDIIVKETNIGSGAGTPHGILHDRESFYGDFLQWKIFYDCGVAKSYCEVMISDLEPEVKYLIELDQDSTRLDSLITGFGNLPDCEKIDIVGEKWFVHKRDYAFRDKTLPFDHMIDVIIKESGICSADKTSVGTMYRKKQFRRDFRKWKAFYNCK